MPCIEGVNVSQPTAGTGARRARVLTGFRPSGPRLHVGHWFGNVLNMVRLQEEHDTFFFVADWHMLTTDYEDTSRLPQYVRGVVLDFLAAGLDPDRSTIYLQSDVTEVA